MKKTSDSRFFCCPFYWALLSIMIMFPLVIKAQPKRVTIQGLSSLFSNDFLTKEGAIYVVKSDYNLGGRVIDLPTGVSIELDGGSIHNGVINLKSNCKLVGKGNNKVECKQLTVNLSGRNVQIDNVSISNDNGVAIRSYSNCSNLLITNCRISSSADNAIKLVADNIKNVIENVQIEQCDIIFKRMGVEIQNHGNNSCRFKGVIIKGCSFTMLSNPQYGYAISLSGFGRDARVENNSINSCLVGIEIVGFSDVTISKNRMYEISNKAIVTSNLRTMNNVQICDNRIDSPHSRIQLVNTKGLTMKNNEMRILYVELGGSSKALISNNNISSFGHYAVMIDGTNMESRDNVVTNNQIEQLGDNWAVFRCYGKKATKNKIHLNNVKRGKSKGVLYDQINGASKNILRK
ncbi:MAG: right-handed parallel beta-helix repeat-containing protein [Prevotella sp.]|nr:right-handed parallel beta-helix repeat-containing protein [Prevotella sp.]